MDHIITNSFVNKAIETCIIKTYINDPLPVFLISNPLDECAQKKGKINFYMRFFFFTKTRSKNLEIP